MKKYFIFFTLLYFISAPFAQASNVSSTGFIPGQIWYSKDNITEGETVKIYTAVWNNNSSSLFAKVEFYDKNVILGSREIVVPALQLQETFIAWKVTSGDHSISAKIISPNITTNGKKVSVSVNNITETSSVFVPIVINTIAGTPATSSDILQSQLGKATSTLDGIVPVSISNPVSEKVSVVDNFRTDTLKNILATKNTAEKKIEEINKIDSNTKEVVPVGKVANSKVSTPQVKGVENATEKPIAYIKLFLFSILSFIFGSKVVFYLLIIIILFLVVRGIYRKIRNR